MLATGTFDVRREPLEGTPPLERFSLDKQYHGELAGSGTGAMLSWRAGSDGAAVYVALERVEGILNGAAGSFVLVHQGTMTADDMRLTISVVPGSGVGELTDLSGSMSLRIDEGTHHYEFRYELPAPGESGE